MPDNFSRVLIFLSLVVAEAGIGQNLTFRCDKKVKICEIDSSRLTIGDWVGIFDQDERLVAIGKIQKLKGTLRVFEIMERYTRVTRNHRVKFITDEQAQDPSVFFQLTRKIPYAKLGANLGLMSYGIGEGLSGLSLSGYWQSHLNQAWFWVGRIEVTQGKGKASIRGQSLETYAIELGYLSVFGGIAWNSNPAAEIFARFEGDLGLTHVSGSNAGGYKLVDLVDDRVKKGFVSSFRAEATLVVRIDDDWDALIGFEVLRVDRSDNQALFLGAEFSM